MARRRSGERRGKSSTEARFERITWILLVAPFAFLYIFPESLTAQATNFMIPLLACVVMIGSGIIQYFRGWRASPVTWIMGAICGGIAYYVLRVNAAGNFLVAVLAMVIVTIVSGIVLGDT